MQAGFKKADTEDRDYVRYQVINEKIRHHIIRYRGCLPVGRPVLSGKNRPVYGFLPWKGDCPAPGGYCGQLGIRELRAGCLPEDKLQYIKAGQSQADYICMIGDGINDAPALKHAHVGIAMGAWAAILPSMRPILRWSMTKYGNFPICFACPAA